MIVTRKCSKFLWRPWQHAFFKSKILRGLWICLAGQQKSLHSSKNETLIPVTQEKFFQHTNYKFSTTRKRLSGNIHRPDANFKTLTDNDKMWPYLRKPGIRDKSKMHWKCVEKCIDNALQRISTRWKRFPTRWNYFQMRWQRFAMRWQRSSTRWTTHCKLHKCVAFNNRLFCLSRKSQTIDIMEDK